VTAAFETADIERVLEVYGRDFERFFYPKAVPPALAAAARRDEGPNRRTG
jgi:hypothetical protein